jgi:hypothetical protein
MELDQQLKVLINDAPQYGVATGVMEQAVIPVLKAFARQLQHSQYYVLQTIQQNWILTTLSNRQRQNSKKTVIYGFSTLKDAANFQGTSDPQIMAMSLPVTHLLFQLFALKGVDSIIFMEEPGNITTGIEVHRTDLQNSIQAQLKELGKSLISKPNNLPPDIA